MPTENDIEKLTIQVAELLNEIKNDKHTAQVNALMKTTPARQEQPNYRNDTGLQQRQRQFSSYQQPQQRQFGNQPDRYNSSSQTSNFNPAWRPRQPMTTNWNSTRQQPTNGQYVNNQTSHCFNCGLSHARDNCRANGVVCYNCGRNNHFSRMCRQPQNFQRP
jgi:hypothetical protein